MSERMALALDQIRWLTTEPGGADDETEFGIGYTAAMRDVGLALRTLTAPAQPDDQEA